MAARPGVVPVIEAGHPVPDAAGLAGGGADAGAGQAAGPRRSRAGADVGRRLGQLDRARRGPDARREAGGDPRAAEIGRRHRRDQHGAQAPLPPQGRAARARGPSGPGRDPGDFRRARRRSGGDRLRADRPRSDHARRRARDRGALPPRRSRRRDGVRSPIRPTKRPSPAIRSSRTRIPHRRAPGRRRSRAAEAAVRAAGYECVFLGDRVEGEAREVAAAHARLARELQAQGRRAVILSGGELTVTLRGQGPRRTEPGIRAGARARARRRARASRRSPATPTAPTAAAAVPTTRPAPSSTTTARAAPGRSASIPPSFLPTTIRRGFSRGSATCLEPGPTYTNINDFRAILVDRP